MNGKKANAKKLTKYLDMAATGIPSSVSDLEKLSIKININILLYC